MEIKLDVNINDSEININFDDNKNNLKILNVDNLDFNIKQPTLYFLLNENKLGYIGQTIYSLLETDKSFDKVITITVPNELNLEYLESSFLKEASENSITLVNTKILKSYEISEEQENDLNEYKDKILFIIKSFGYDIFNLKNDLKTVNKPHPAKARHKWTKEISQIEFNANSKDGEGKVIWKSKDELVLLSGAKLVVNPQLNKDGTINYSAQFAQKLRLDHLDKIANNVTIVDIAFQSPNQLGMFLFYGGQNTWLELKDRNGKTLDDWSRVD